MTSRTEQFLRGCAVKVLIARDILDATVFSLTCAISSTTPPERLVHDLQSKYLPQPFVGGPVVLVTKDEILCLDDSACDRFRQMCSEVARWTMIYDGPGAEAPGPPPQPLASWIAPPFAPAGRPGQATCQTSGLSAAHVTSTFMVHVTSATALIQAKACVASLFRLCAYFSMIA